MPVQRFRSVSEMPRVPRVRDSQLPERITALWRRAAQMAGSVVVPGVQRFRSIEEANAARDAATLQRMRRGAGPREER